MDEAKTLNKPVCLVMYTTWCPHCRNYAKVFSDSRVVQAADKLVMIRIDADRNATVANRYAPDGHYIPRTLMLSPNGRVLPIHAKREQHAYFYDEANPDDLLAAMHEAAP
jgi:hypothetical protein